MRDRDRVDFFEDQRCAQAAGIGEAGAGQRLGIERAVLGGEQRPEAFRGRPGPALADVVRLEPVTPQAGLALCGDLVLEAIPGSVVERERRDAGPPEPDIDPGLFEEQRREWFVEVAPAHGEAERVRVGRLDLRGEHSRRRRRGGSGSRSGLEHGDREPAQRGGAGACRAHHTAADYRDVIRSHVLAPV